MELSNSIAFDPKSFLIVAPSRKKVPTKPPLFFPRDLKFPHYKIHSVPTHFPCRTLHGLSASWDYFNSPAFNFACQSFKNGMFSSVIAPVSVAASIK